ncbi:putative Polysaccharide biosynthesis protein C-terminal domain-containing protein [Vibrio crassostreae]|nr:putative Polysaccharide biosynthesis protein C-terminal domain-containing protein [Vibrio crassostreae]CAK2951265.1 putative Polysaccharide biosynthesis protein C-terminal domain-containing protein [Vibrio crassostreae]CAK2952154.1 putative Polysaccharide biosynthesis protein C-terminal domain-containing protein [Vibrio crassostreae]CAK2952640.1 putative Polysaccharide biosynthesis protein C-terminal domain-containing protein [Vibrio crassostreae]CAK2954876.1 putative Polysaccharide biosynth
MFRNFLSLSFSTGSRILINAVLLIVLARYLGAEQYGILVTCLATSSIAVIILDFGFSTYLVKSIAENKSLVQDEMRGSLIVKFYLSIIYLMLSQILGLYFVGLEYNHYFSVLMLVTFLNSFIDFFCIPFRAISKFQEEAKIQVFASLLHIVIIISAFYYESLYSVIYSYLIVKFIILCYCFIKFKREFEFSILPSINDLHYKNAIKILYKLKYYGLDSAIINIRANVDVIIVKSILGYEMAGIYQAASNIVKSIERVGPIFANLYLPKLSKRDGFYKKNFKQLVILMIAMSFFSAVVLNSVDFGLVLGTSFDNVDRILVILTFYLIFRYLSMALGTHITAVGLQSKRVKIGLFNLLLSIASNYYFTLYYGVYGAAAAMAITALMLFVCYFFVYIKSRG